MPEITAPGQSVLSDGVQLKGTQVARRHPDVTWASHAGDASGAYVALVSITGKRGVLRKVEFKSTGGTGAGDIFLRMKVDGGAYRYGKLTAVASTVSYRYLHAPFMSSHSSEGVASSGYGFVWDGNSGAGQSEEIVHFENSLLIEIKGLANHGAGGVAIVEHD